jgi:hypothetical protein
VKDELVRMNRILEKFAFCLRLETGGLIIGWWVMVQKCKEIVEIVVCFLGWA